MSQAEIPFEEALDPVARRFSRLPRFFTNLINRVTHGAANRDGCRTPMQWNDSPHAGFCTETADPWLPVNADYLTKNVNAGKLGPDSLYNCYRRFLTVRKENRALQTGELELIPTERLPKSVLGYKRFFRDDPEQFFVFLNFSRDPQNVTASVQNPALIVSTSANKKTNFVKKDTNNVTFSLGPYEGIVVRNVGLDAARKTI
jgi:glycosidase